MHLLASYMLKTCSWQTLKDSKHILQVNFRDCTVRGKILANLANGWQFAKFFLAKDFRAINSPKFPPSKIFPHTVFIWYYKPSSACT